MAHDKLLPEFQTIYSSNCCIYHMVFDLFEFFLFPFLVSHAQVPDGGPLNAHRRPRHGSEHELVYLDTWQHQNVFKDTSIIKRQRKLSSYFTLQPLLKLDHGGFPQQPEHVEVEKGGAGNR